MELGLDMHPGTKQHAQERFPSQQGSSADWSWTARAHRDIIDMQHMFSVYVHCPPDFSYAPGNLFAGYEVPGRVPVTWGQWSVVSKLLLSLEAPFILVFQAPWIRGHGLPDCSFWVTCTAISFPCLIFLIHGRFCMIWHFCENAIEMLGHKSRASCCSCKCLWTACCCGTSVLAQPSAPSAMKCS